MPVPSWSSLEEGIVLATTNIGADLDYKITLSLNVAFEGFKLFEGEPLIVVLSQMASFVDRLIHLFEGHFFTNPGGGHGS